MVACPRRSAGSLGPLTLMSFRMVRDACQLLWIFVVLLLAFASGIIAVYKDLPVAPSTALADTHQPVATGASLTDGGSGGVRPLRGLQDDACAAALGASRLQFIWMAMLTTPLNGDPPEFECFADSAHTGVATVLTRFYQLFSAVLLLNMLIAKSTSRPAT